MQLKVQVKVKEKKRVYSGGMNQLSSNSETVLKYVNIAEDKKKQMISVQRECILFGQLVNLHGWK